MTQSEFEVVARAPGVELDRVHNENVVLLHGDWTLRGLGESIDAIDADLKRATRAPDAIWDLSDVSALDTTGALVLWRAWQRKMPAHGRIPDRHQRLFEYWIAQDEAGTHLPPRRPSLNRRTYRAMVNAGRNGTEQTLQWLDVLGRFALDSASIAYRPRSGPWRELSATIYLAGLRALPITGLVGVLIGIVVAYLAALQLRMFGAEQFIVDMLGFGIIRELGPLLAAIIVAGRSGSAMTAQIGVMRLAQELDAMSALGISISQRLIWPKIVALTLVMPLVALWTILAALAGGIAATQVTLELGLSQFIDTMPNRVPPVNLWIGLGKAVVFGAAIGLTAAHFGLRIQPNTRDLGAQTTRAVVASITLVIIINAIFAVLLQDVGFR
jgi:phospholipid/cholesterol/gamma-HCH transport system permease protein